MRKNRYYDEILSRLRSGKSVTMKELFKNKTVLASVVFAVIQTLFCIIACACKIDFWITVVVAIVLLACYTVAVIYFNRKKNVLIVNASKPDLTLTFKTINNSLLELCDLCTDEDVKTELKNIAEEFSFSDPVSNAEMHDTEDEIILLISQIKDELSSCNNNSIKQLLQTLRVKVNNRNRLCKGNKK